MASVRRFVVPETPLAARYLRGSKGHARPRPSPPKAAAIRVSGRFASHHRFLPEHRFMVQCIERRMDPLGSRAKKI